MWRRGAAAIVAALNSSRELDAVVGLDLSSERQRDENELENVSSKSVKLHQQARANQREVRRCVEKVVEQVRVQAREGEAMRAQQLRQGVAEVEQWRRERHAREQKALRWDGPAGHGDSGDSFNV